MSAGYFNTSHTQQMLPHEVDEAGTDAEMELQVDTKHHEHHESEQQRNELLRPLGDIYALGDCSANIGTPLPALAQVFNPHKTTSLLSLQI